uniref:Uncharacterized protein n=1 Tax=Arundo donax TaxID=35708 RepID=A0A0A9FX30_ARUDO
MLSCGASSILPSTRKCLHSAELRSQAFVDGDRPIDRESV